MERSTLELQRLQEAVSADPGNAEQHYLLGAELASLRQYEAAMQELARALQLNPQLHTARLQLGFLYLNAAQPGEAVATWRVLEQLPAGDPLHLFASGLRSLVQDNFDACIAQLEAGVRANDSNVSLNRDMGMLIERVRGLTASTMTLVSAAPTEDAVPSAPMDLGLYGGTKH